MNYTQPILRTADKIPEHRYLQKIQSIGEDLSKFAFRSKFYELTQSNVFTFDIQKIITDKNNKIICKLCQYFYQFLAIRMVLRIFEQKNPGLDRIKEQQLQKSKENKKSLYRLNSIQNQLELKHEKRGLKNRANTTVNISNDSVLQLNKQNTGTKSRKTMVNQYSKQNLTTKSKSIIQQEQEDIRISEHNQIAQLLLETNENIKQAYYELTESFKNRTRVQKLQIICFLIALLSPDILHVLVQSIDNQFRQKHEYIKTQNSQTSEQSQYPIQQEIYIILTYQTLGNFVSSSVYKCLRKKYIKHTIFNYESDRGYYKLVKSLKHIKDRLTQKDVILIKGRRQKALEKQRLRKKNSLILQDDKCYSKQKMRNFIKQTLKTKQQIDYNSVAKINHSKQDELDEINNKIQQSFYPSFSQNKTATKIVLSKDSPASKYSISLKQKLSLNNFKINRGDQIKRKKYVQSVQKTYYKFRPNNEKKQDNKVVKSARSSYKFSKLPIEDNQTAVIRLRNQKQQIQHMKFKIGKFKESAIKDLQIIQQCKPSKLHRQFRKEYRYFDDKQNFNLELNNRNPKVFSQKIIFTDKRGNNQKSSPKNLNSQKQQIWHEMYNIRAEPIASTCKSSKQVPKIVYKLAKQSDKLRKDKYKFMEHCRDRAEILQEDLDLVDRMRMGVK